MRHYRQELTLQTPTRVAIINITPQVEEAVRASGVR